MFKRRRALKDCNVSSRAVKTNLSEKPWEQRKRLARLIFHAPNLCAKLRACNQTKITCKLYLYLNFSVPFFFCCICLLNLCSSSRGPICAGSSSWKPAKTWLANRICYFGVGFVISRVTSTCAGSRKFSLPPTNEKIL